MGCRQTQCINGPHNATANAPCQSQRQGQNAQRQQNAAGECGIGIGEHIFDRHPSQHTPTRALHRSHGKQALHAIGADRLNTALGLRGGQVGHLRRHGSADPGRSVTRAQQNRATPVEDHHQRALRQRTQSALPQLHQVHGKADQPRGLALRILDGIEQHRNPAPGQGPHRSPPHRHRGTVDRIPKTRNATQFIAGDLLAEVRAVIAPCQILYDQIGEFGIELDELNNDGVTGLPIQSHDHGPLGNALENRLVVAQHMFQTGRRGLGQKPHPLGCKIPRHLSAVRQVVQQDTQHRKKHGNQQQHELCTHRQTAKSPHRYTPPSSPRRLNHRTTSSGHGTPSKVTSPHQGRGSTRVDGVAASLSGAFQGRGIVCPRPKTRQTLTDRHGEISAGRPSHHGSALHWQRSPAGRMRHELGQGPHVALTEPLGIRGHHSQARAHGAQHARGIRLDFVEHGAYLSFRTRCLQGVTGSAGRLHGGEQSLSAFLFLGTGRMGRKQQRQGAQAQPPSTQGPVQPPHHVTPPSR